MRYSLFIYISILLLGVSCTKEKDIYTIEEEPFEPVLNVEVASLVVSIGEDIPFTCIINEEEYTSLGGGILLIQDLLMDKTGSTIRIESEGYYDEIRYVIPSIGANHHLEVALTRIKSSNSYSSLLGTFQSQEGTTLSKFKVEIDIPANAIEDGSGNLYEGQVNVYGCNLFSAAYFSNTLRFPTNSFEEDGVSKTHNIGGGFYIVLLDNLDNELYLKEGIELNIRFELQSAEQVGIKDVSELVYFDFEGNQWKSMGTITKEDEVWSGTVDKLGLVAWGTTYESRIASLTLKTDEGLIAPNKMVWVFGELNTPMTNAFSDNNGNVKLRVPVGVDFRVSSLDFNGNFVFAFNEYGTVGSGAEEVLELDDLILNSELYQMYQGNVVDCDNNVVQNSAISMKGYSNSIGSGGFEMFVFSDDQGQFNFVQSKTEDNPIRMFAYDIETNQVSQEYPIFNFSEKTIDFGSLSICE